MDDRSLLAGDPIAYAGSKLKQNPQDHPHACSGGWVYLAYTAHDGETGEEVEMVERLPYRRCADR